MYCEGPRYNSVFDEMFDMNRDGELDAGEANLEYEYIEESIREDDEDEGDEDNRRNRFDEDDEEDSDADDDWD